MFHFHNFQGKNSNACGQTGSGLGYETFANEPNENRCQECLKVHNTWVNKEPAWLEKK